MMTVSAGTRLGPYEIVAPLGAGGMGEVYRARDARLDRSVAIKVLLSRLGRTPELRQRFEREAKTISQLSHPHICALYDVGREGDLEYLVMELLEGETLADRLGRGLLPLDQALRYGIEIADALDAAHRRGIVHRDLKPGNVMLTKSGVKLLDFGLAKVIAPSRPDSVTMLPTQISPATEAGTVLGTFPYMSPELLEGKEADARSDIFALGAVLYEMTAGRKAFAGVSQASLISQIMQTDPPSVSSVRSVCPPALDGVVRTCLAKDPDDRWQTARDVMLQLKAIAERPLASASASAPSRRGPQWFAWIAIGIALLLSVWTVLRRPPRQAEPGVALRSSLVFPDLSAVRAAALSPDGTQLAMVGRDSSGKTLLFLRSLDSAALRALPGTESPAFPFWSPDGRFLAFFAEGKLKKIDPAGGPAQTICNAPVARGGTWGRDGTILFSPVTDGPIYRVSASGGAPVPVTKLDPVRKETSHRWPLFLPDGRHFLYLVASFVSSVEQEKMGVYVRALDTGEEQFLVRTNSNMAYAPPGYLLFVREGTLLAQRFDGKTFHLAGDPFPVAEQVQFAAQTYFGFFSVSQNQILIDQSRSAASGQSQLVWFDRTGKALGTLGSPGYLANPRISPDGKKVVLDITDARTGNIDVWISEMTGTMATRFTTDPAIDSLPVWSPKGDRIAFMSFRRGHPDLYQKAASGAGAEEPILISERSNYPTDWSPDGRYVLYRSLVAGGNVELWVVSVGGGEPKATPFLQATYGVSYGQFSPNGRWIAYASNESGRGEVYVAPFPGPGGSWRISSAGGSQPRWRRDGRELFYLAPDGKLMAVAVKAGDAFEAETATPLFSTRPREPSYAGDLFTYDVSADGQRFLVNTEAPLASAPSLEILLNWAKGK